VTEVTLTPGHTTLDTLRAISHDNATPALCPSARPAVERAAAVVERAVAGDKAIYGINTGFGKLAAVRIAAADTATLQRNLILSHCAGVGEPTDIATTRLMMALKLLSLGRGASGVRWKVVAQIQALLAHGITPVVPAQGSVGASGDLAPLAHMAATLLGEGLAHYRGERMASAAALDAAGIEPIELAAKEGLALINGTQFSTACQAAHGLQIEANAVTDNPLVIPDTDDIVSGGNFHAQPVAFAADQMALAISEVGAIAQRRVALMVDPTLSFDLPPFLTPEPGLNSGFMVAEITTAALMSENKHLANPCSTDSTPTSANQEDHVSMAAHAARRLHRMTDNLSHILGVELLCAAQGVAFRAPLSTSEPLQAVIRALRTRVPPLGDDRYMATDLDTAARAIRTGTFSARRCRAP